VERGGRKKGEGVGTKKGDLNGGESRGMIGKGSGQIFKCVDRNPLRKERGEWGQGKKGGIWDMRGILRDWGQRLSRKTHSRSEQGTGDFSKKKNGR